MKKLNNELIDLGVYGIMAGASMGIINDSSMSTPIKRGATALIGVGFINKASKLFK